MEIDKEYLDQKFESIDKKFDSIDKRFEQIDQRFDNVDKKFEETKDLIKESTEELARIVAKTVAEPMERGFQEIREHHKQTKSW